MAKELLGAEDDDAETAPWLDAVLLLEEDSGAVELDGLLVDAAALLGLPAEELLVGPLLLLMVDVTIMLVDAGAAEDDMPFWVDVAVAVEDDTATIPELPEVVMR